MRGWIGEVQVVLLGIVFLGIVFLERFIAAPSRSPRQVRSQLPSLYSATFGWIAGAWGGFYRLPWLSFFLRFYYADNAAVRKVDFWPPSSQRWLTCLGR